MDEENEQKNGLGQNAKNAVKMAGKKVAQQAKKEIFKKIIVTIAPILLKCLAIALCVLIIVSSIMNFIDGIKSEKSKKANSSAITYSSSSGSSSETNKITVDISKATNNGAYKLNYKFEDENGKVLTDEKAINQIKKDLLEENEKIDLGKFSDSELKIIGSLMYNGLDTSKYNEEELKALTIFVKAEIAGQTFNLREDRVEVKAEDITDNDEVYGTLELHKTTPTPDEHGNLSYNEVKLQYVEYSTFKTLIEKKDKSVLNMFSIDDEQKLVIARASYKKITYKYKDGQEIPKEDIKEINGDFDGKNENTYTIKEYPLPIDYEPYIKQYIASYGFLSDLLITTNNVNFCLEIAELALNSKIVINLREEQTQRTIYEETDYTQTTLLYDYVKYKIGEKAFPQTLIVGGHITESNDIYTIDEDYTAKQEITDTVIVETETKNYKYDVDVSEIDCWYLTYKRPYEEPEKKESVYPPPEGNPGSYPENATVVQAPTKDSSIIDSDTHVQAFIVNKQEEYPYVDEVECKVTELTTKKKTKTSSKIAKYVETKTKYVFGDEENLDVTQTQFKNLEYINNVPSFTTNGPKGFLYIYDKYISSGIDLHLQNDAEKQLFELLESDKDTEETSYIIKGLLYTYDGIDRGVTDFNKKFEVLDLSFVRRVGDFGTSPFGCTLTKEEFLEATRQYMGESILASLAEDFYDICAEYNVNPCLAYVWAAYESGWGESAPYYNLFGYEVYNGQDSGKVYSSYQDSITDFCEHLVDVSKPDSNMYDLYYKQAKEYSTVNNKYNGRPENNIYALFSLYAWVGNTHTPEARNCIHKTYEYLNKGEYECNHSDEEKTTLKEQADYADYIITSRIDLAKEIFGKNAFISYGAINVSENIIDNAEEIHTMYENEQWTYCSDFGQEEGLNNITIGESLSNPKRVTCGATFVSQVLYKTGIITDEQFLNSGYDFHSPYGVHGILKKYQGDNIKKITDAEDLQAGDIVFVGDNYPNNWQWDHVQIYAGNNTWYDAGSTDSIRLDSPYKNENWNVRILGRIKSNRSC